jgi:serine/threonine-protein kinase
VWLAREGPFPIELAVDFVLQACEALAEAHSLGIVHRDLKPANLFCIQRSDGQMAIKVLDFGISKLTTARASRHDLTRTRTLMGTPLYMSPEQMQSAKKVDERSDIWALGVILYELVSGGPPFDAEAVTDLAIKVATMPAPSLREARGDVPETLARVVAKCLKKAPQERFQTIGELALALQEFAPAHARLSVDRAVATLRRAGEGGGASSPSIEIAIAGVSRALPPSTVRGAETHITTDRRGARGPSGKRALGLIVIGLAAVGLGLWLVAQNATTRTRISAEVPAATPPADTSTRATVAASSPATPPAPAAPPATGVAPVVDVAPSVAPPTSSARAHPVRPASRAAPRPDCDPPYDVAPNGTHVFKKDCF